MSIRCLLEGGGDEEGNTCAFGLRAPADDDTPPLDGEVVVIPREPVLAKKEEAIIKATQDK